jgi:tRNA (cmo5U34)-methyltransferase
MPSQNRLQGREAATAANTMRSDELKAAFDQQAPRYDERWGKLAPVRDALHFLLESVFGGLPEDARILCVGVGTGAELAHLAGKFPRWTFTAVEPSGAMLDVCRQRAETEGFALRCHFHEGYVDSLPAMDLHDAATCFLVSQFILDRTARSGFFRSIASRLQPGGLLASSDLASEVGSDAFKSLVDAWLRMMAAADVSPEARARTLAAWEKDVAILHPADVASIIGAGGFEAPVQFFQAGLIHAWISRRAPGSAG